MKVNTDTDAVESLSREVSPFGIRALLVEPGTFRTDLLAETNRKTAQSKFDDYNDLREAVERGFADLNGNQTGDTVKGVSRIIDIVKGENGTAGKDWPYQLPIGSDAVAVIRKKCEDTLRELDLWEGIAQSTDF